MSLVVLTLRAGLLMGMRQRVPSMFKAFIIIFTHLFKYWQLALILFNISAFRIIELISWPSSIEIRKKSNPALKLQGQVPFAIMKASTAIKTKTETFASHLPHSIKLQKENYGRITSIQGQGHTI